MNGQTPASPISVKRLVSTGFVALSALVALGIAAITLPKFQELFAGFGLDPPMPTRVFIQYRGLTTLAIGLLQLAQIATFMGLVVTRRDTFRKANTALAIVSYLVFALFVFAMYLPIFHLGAVV